MEEGVHEGGRGEGEGRGVMRKGKEVLGRKRLKRRRKKKKKRGVE